VVWRELRLEDVIDLSTLCSESWIDAKMLCIIGSLAVLKDAGLSRMLV
jgi:hypothetical protein